MTTPPQRYRDPETPDEHLAAARARQRNQPPPKLETDEYKAYRADALRAAGLTDEGDEIDAGAEPDQSVASELDKIRSRWHR